MMRMSYHVMGGCISHTVELGPTEQKPGRLDVAEVQRLLRAADQRLGRLDSIGARQHAALAFALISESLRHVGK